MDYTYQIRLRRGTSIQWELSNPILSSGEPGFATDLNYYKIGDGVTPWNELPWTTGLKGDSPTITIGQTETGSPGTAADVTNSGDDLNAIFDFTIPEGLPGRDLVVHEGSIANPPEEWTAKQLLWDPNGEPDAGFNLPQRITRPNVDDRLVEVWDGSKWIVTHYDSGWRNIAASVTPGSGTTLNLLLVQRTTSAVNYILSWDQSGNLTGAELMQWAAPEGFRGVIESVWQIWSTSGIVTGRVYTSGGSTMNFQPLPSKFVRGFVSHPTTDTTPTTLPGTILTPAP